MRQTAPVSPAIHLGAQRVLVIGAGRMHEPRARVEATGYPSLAQIAGHALSNIFLDAWRSTSNASTHQPHVGAAAGAARS